MKHCIKCEFSKGEAVQTPHGFQTVFLCQNEECSDPVSGDPMPCHTVRSNPQFCGIKATFWKKKEEKPEASVVQLA